MGQSHFRTCVFWGFLNVRVQAALSGAQGVCFMSIFVPFLLVLKNLINELWSCLWEYDYAEINCQAR